MDANKVCYFGVDARKACYANNLDPNNEVFFFWGWLVDGGGTGVGGFIFVGSLYIHQKDMLDTWTWYSEMYGAVVIFCDV